MGERALTRSARCGVVAVWSRDPRRGPNPLPSSSGAFRPGKAEPSQPWAKPHSSNAVPAVEVSKRRAGVVPVWSRDRCQPMQQQRGQARPTAPRRATRERAPAPLPAWDAHAGASRKSLDAVIRRPCGPLRLRLTAEPDQRPQLVQEAFAVGAQVLGYEFAWKLMLGQRRRPGLLVRSRLHSHLIVETVDNRLWNRRRTFGLSSGAFRRL
jgi:hypothetical protein